MVLVEALLVLVAAVSAEVEAEVAAQARCLS